MSVLLRPGAADPERGWLPLPPKAYAWLPLLAGVAVAEAVTRLAELPDGVCPPSSGPTTCWSTTRSVAGILAEGVPDGAGEAPAVVLGSGST